MREAKALETVQGLMGRVEDKNVRGVPRTIFG